ncbi:MAG: glycosyltransferase family 4 protein [Chloroflexi bacterium]|nr:glycosyltransferase family 4 protein [Chloroflexota bacterium]
MKRLNVGIFFNARRGQGGLFQYALTLIHCLGHHSAAHTYILFFATLEEPAASIADFPFPSVYLPRPAVQLRMAIEYLLMLTGRAGLRAPIRFVPRYRRIDQENLDLMIYVKPTMHSFMWPYRSVFPIHDLQHLLQPSFAEVSSKGERSRREFIYRNAVPNAGAVLTDSEIGREDVLSHYSVDPPRIHALPFLAPPYLTMNPSPAHCERIRSRYSLPKQFFFYPAGFWPHKNHAILIRALQILKTDFHTEIDVVFAGGYGLEYSSLQSLAASNEVSDRVHFLGYVPDEDIYPLYRLATALVMPTYFGPTNIPIIEAWNLDCPVVTSDIRGLREQVGDAGLFARPDDAAGWASALHRIVSEPELPPTLIQHGREKVRAWTPRDYASRLESILSLSVSNGAS